MISQVDYDRLNRVVRKQRAALTRAVKSRDRDRVVEVCKKAVAEWSKPGMMWPDNWSDWQRALNDVYPVFEAPSLEDLAPLSGPLQRLQEHANELRATADGLDAWVRNGRDGDAGGGVHPSHAANRLRKMADEIDGGKET